MTSTIFKSPMPDIDIPEMPLTQFVMQRAVSMPDEPAMIDGVTGRVYSFSELSDAIHRLAGGLQAEGFGEGSVLALVAPNCPEFAIVFHAVAVCGGTVTTVNPLYGEEELRQQFIDSNASIAITVPACIENCKAAMSGSGVGEVLVIGDASGHRSIEDVMRDPIEQVPIDVRSNILVLPYSSGTTGLPKGVMLTHHNLVANLAQINACLHYEPGEVAMAVLPFFHIYGMQVLMGSLLAEGVSIVTVPRFDMETVLSLIQQHKVTQFFAVPPIVLGLAKHPLVDSYDVSSMQRIFSGAAPLGGDVAMEASKRVDCLVVQGYGMTEMSPVSHLTAADQLKPGSCGITIPNTLSRIVDDQGNDLGAGEEGELLVKGPQVMQGYLNNPEATAQTLDSDGWLHTGDVARIDEDGHMFIVDRVKELIKYNGFQVAPAELEALLVTHPAVADAAVIGVPDESAGELPKAFITLKAEPGASAEELQQFVKDQVAGYKQIRLVEFVDSIPKSASGKILRRQLRDS